MDATERRLLVLLAERASPVTGSARSPYRIYPRKTRKTGRGGKPISIYYFQRWNPELRRYETARSTGQTNRAAAETWAAAQLAAATDSKTTLAAFAAGMFDEGSEYLRHRAERGREMSWNHRTHNAHYLERYVLPSSATQDSPISPPTPSSSFSPGCLSNRTDLGRHWPPTPATTWSVHCGSLSSGRYASS